MVQMEPFLVFMPFWYSASRPSLVSRRLLRSSIQVSLFFLKVLVFHWSRHCCRVFDVSRGDGSEFSPVSFHGSLKVDFEPMSVKLGLIATTGATHSNTLKGKNGAFPDSRAGLAAVRWKAQFFIRNEVVYCDHRSHLFGVSFFCGIVGRQKWCSEYLMHVSVVERLIGKRGPSSEPVWSEVLQLENDKYVVSSGVHWIQAESESAALPPSNPGCSGLNNTEAAYQLSNFMLELSNPTCMLQQQPAWTFQRPHSFCIAVCHEVEMCVVGMSLKM